MPRLAIILPNAYRGGTLSWVRSLAKMLQQGSREAGDEWQLVVCPLEGYYDIPVEFADCLERQIDVRPISWRVLTEPHARHILSSAGLDPDQESFDEPYCLPCDGRNDLLDCDGWCFVSDRVPHRILPVRPYSTFIADVLQRYAPEGFSDEFFEHEKRVMIPFVRRAEFVMTTTPAAREDVHGYFGIPRRKMLSLPFFYEPKKIQAACRSTPDSAYFVWLSNAAPHKNHHRVLEALRQYYAKGGTLRTFLMGPETDLFHPDAPRRTWEHRPYVLSIRDAIATSGLADRIDFAGELPESEYADALARGRFLLSANLYDNGSFSTVDAVQLGRPCLCAAYPAQQFMDRTLGLNARWFDPYDSRGLASKLLEMEKTADSIPLPAPSRLQAFAAEKRAGEVFAAFQERFQGAAYAYR